MRTQYSYYYIFIYTLIDYLNYGIYLQWRDPLFFIRYNNTIQHLHVAKLYLVGKRPKPFKYLPFTPLYFNPLSMF